MRKDVNDYMGHTKTPRQAKHITKKKSTFTYIKTS